MLRRLECQLGADDDNNATMNAYYLVRGFLLGSRIISTESNATLCQLQALDFYNRTQEA